jgi:type I restriction enzyme M protein
VELRRYSFFESRNIDVKGKAYEELVGANLRSDRGEFSAPSKCAKNDYSYAGAESH